MKLKILKNNKENLFIEVSEVSRAFMNSFRRIILEEIPTMAIEDVEFYKNDSVLYDEIIAHRLGLIPLKTDLSSYVLAQECSCGGVGCAKCQVSLTLSRKGVDVKASDMESQDPAIVPVFPDTLITKLTNEQAIELISYARLGKGKEHAKWAPGFVYFRPKVSLDLKNVKSAKDLDKICPKKVFKDGKVNYLTKCDVCGLCEDRLGVKITESSSEYLMYLESFGQLTFRSILTNAMDIMISKVKDFRAVFNQ